MAWQRVNWMALIFLGVSYWNEAAGATSTTGETHALRHNEIHRKTLFDGSDKPVCQTQMCEDDAPICPICLEPIHKENASFSCSHGHAFHQDCLTKSIAEVASCPICRVAIPRDERAMNWRHQCFLDKLAGCAKSADCGTTFIDVVLSLTNDVANNADLLVMSMETAWNIRQPLVAQCQSKIDRHEAMLENSYLSYPQQTKEGMRLLKHLALIRASWERLFSDTVGLKKVDTMTPKFAGYFYKHLEGFNEILIGLMRVREKELMQDWSRNIKKFNRLFKKRAFNIFQKAAPSVDDIDRRWRNLEENYQEWENQHADIQEICHRNRQLQHEILALLPKPTADTFFGMELLPDIPYCLRQPEREKEMREHYRHARARRDQWIHPRTRSL